MEIKLPRKAADHPFEVQVKAGEKYSWCSCGMTQTEPFCDGAHKAFTNPDGSKIMKSVKFFPEKDETVLFCGCKHSTKGMFCDEFSCKSDATGK